MHVPIVEHPREEDGFEVVRDENSKDTLTAGAGAETFARKDVFLFAPGIGVGERGGSVGCRVDMGRFHVDWSLGVWWQREGTGAYEILVLEIRHAQLG